MAENTAYFDSVISARSVLIDCETSMDATVSLETQQDLLEESIGFAIKDNFPVFYQALKFLTKEDQELLLSYYLLHKPQWCLAKVRRSTQTDCSFRLRMAIKKLGGSLLFGIPDEEKLSTILDRYNMEFFHPKAKTSTMVFLYRKYRSFDAVSKQLGIPRPQIRKTLSKVTKALLELEDDNIAASIGAYIFGLIDKASASGIGLSKRKLSKQGHSFRSDPSLLGEFRISVLDPDFDHILVSRANI